MEGEFEEVVGEAFPNRNPESCVRPLALHHHLPVVNFRQIPLIQITNVQLVQEPMYRYIAVFVLVVLVEVVIEIDCE